MNTRNLLFHWDDSGRMFRLNRHTYVCCDCGYNLQTNNPDFMTDVERKEIALGFTDWSQVRDYERSRVAAAEGQARR